jgi:hypothetical protein
MDRAVELGRQWLKKTQPKFEGFRPSRFTLLRISEGNAAQQWLWQLGFDPALGGRWLSDPSFEVYLLMDGSVIVPTVSTHRPPTH